MFRKILLVKDQFLIMRKIVIAGAGFGGLVTALRLQKTKYEVVLIDKNDYFQFKPDLVFLGNKNLNKNDLTIDLKDFVSDLDINFKKQRIESFCPDKKLVKTGKETLEYDKLVLALGGEVATYGLDVEKVNTVYNLNKALKTFKKLKGSDEVIVIGSGYTGIEIAKELEDLEKNVKLVTKGNELMKNSCDKASDLAIHKISNSDIKLLNNSKVRMLKRDSLRTGSGKFLSGDIIIWAGGLQSSKVVQESFGVGPSGLPVDTNFRSKRFDNVFALGDNAESGLKKTGQVARRQGEIIAYNLNHPGRESKAMVSKDFPLLVSTGGSAILEYRDKAYASSLFKYFKKWERVYFWAYLKLVREI